MSWENIGLATVAVLLPYLAKAGEAIAKSLGEDMYNWLKAQFGNNNDNDAVKAIEFLESKPDAEIRVKMLAETISERAKNDPDNFGLAVKQRLEAIQQQPNSTGSLVGSIIAGKVSIINVAGNVEGDIHQG